VDIDWTEELERLWEELVPKSGQADTVQGELIRCIGKLTDEAYRNGNLNWDTNHELMCKFIGTILDDEKVFSQEERGAIRKAVADIIEEHEDPDVSGDGSPHYLLGEMAVRWCLANTAPKPRKEDPDLAI
jgi:hypothetical protein